MDSYQFTQVSFVYSVVVLFTESPVLRAERGKISETASAMSTQSDGTVRRGDGCGKGGQTGKTPNL